MSKLFIYDDATARVFEPFSLTRPTAELRVGSLLLRERWEVALKMKSSGTVSSPHLGNFDEPWGGNVVSGVLPKGSILANSRCAVSLRPLAAAQSWRCGDRVGAVMLDRDVDTEELLNGRAQLEAFELKGSRQVMIQGWWIDHVWDLIALINTILTDDLTHLIEAGQKSAVAAVSGSHPVLIETGATVESHVFFDTTNGPVLVRQGARVQAFTRIVGPCLIGADSIVGVDKIASAAIGEQCRVHGEVNSVVFLGYSNKAHDGFLGHSYLGRWVNLGAGTITSNLKNTYGTVPLWTPDGTRDTGLQFLGTLFGDHAKTGIGMRLTTGTVVGAGANIYGTEVPPKVVQPFAWGDRSPYSSYRVEKFIEVAGRMMARRHVELSSKQQRQLSEAYAGRWSVAAEDDAR